MLERNHDFFDVIEAVSWARKAGFENVNLDLIYGLPGQSLSTCKMSQVCSEINPYHISAYALTLEHGTPFGHWSKRGMIPLPDPDLAADMYEWAAETLARAGFGQYEISNWSKAGLECKHNLQYWRGLPYIAAGAGAHGYANGYRYSNVLRIKSYIERMDTPQNPLEFPSRRLQ
jgi:oxygen-independent coproporphyrinogen-3 oxidase